ncbi:MAG: YmdB family metallophosphoesterase, partial [Candidatus Gastranaerophilales bacterium]|nr:YmdB family metallophosphoesterase [Candidatus Gastranaerophilales bacterium]
LSEELKDKADLIFVDFHAEATAEKISFGHYAKGLGINAVLGTHTHVQTADEKIYDNKMVYITDAGFCGASESIIGMDIDASINRWTTCIHDRLDVVDSPVAQFNAVKFSFNIKDMLCETVERVFYVKDLSSEVI